MTKDIKVTVFFKAGKPCMMIEAKEIETLEALELKIQEWKK